MERINQRTNPIVGANIRRLRNEHRIQNKDLVARLQLQGVAVNSSILSKVEIGINNPTVDMLIALTDIFACDFNEFFKE
jgi:transcriptional regulator with XRE-family HTH domain